MKILGQDTDVVANQLLALYFNVVSWMGSFLPATPAEQKDMTLPCVSIGGPGGLDRLQVVEIPGDVTGGSVRCTCGYNIPGFKPPFANLPLNMDSFPADLVLVRISYFSVNYADVTIRWGLYESALRFVGWPIVPGFDFSGVVEFAGTKSGFTVGEDVYGFTLFGAYSSQVLVPAHQIRKTPKVLRAPAAAAIPAVSATALHAVALAGGWPNRPMSINKAVLIHSAAGGVGMKLVQICKLMGFSPVVGVVGQSNKVQACARLGADVVIDKSTTDLWAAAKEASPEGYCAVFDANGVSTLQDSYDHLSQNGKLITYGFHSNIPKANHFLSPFEWIKMIVKIFQMPKFDPMDMVLSSKTVSGFNLSFFANEVFMIEKYMNQLQEWIEEGKIDMDDVTVFPMSDIAKAHELIQSGSSIGKIVLKVPSSKSRANSPSRTRASLASKAKSH